MAKILQIQPSWKAYSEVWLMRMNDYLKDYLFAIGAFDPIEKKWNDIPVFNLYGEIPPLSIRALQRLKFNGLNTSFPFDRVIKKYLNHKEIDTIFCHFIGPALHFKELLYKSDKKIFIHVHGIDIFWDATEPTNPSKKIYSDKYIGQVLELENYCTFISNSKFTTNQLKKIGVRDDKIKLKYFGVDLPQLVQKQKIKSDLINILFLGRLVDFKGPEIVIQAFNLACKNGLNARLTIAGDGNLRTYCELLRIRSSYSDRITILGSVDINIAQDLFREADIYTLHNCLGQLSNCEEAFGVSIIEAMSFGLPVITGSSNAIQESVVHGETGIVVDQYNIEQHADAFLTLAQNPELRYKMGQAGRDRVKRLFSQELEKKRLFEILNIK